VNGETMSSSSSIEVISSSYKKVNREWKIEYGLYAENRSHTQTHNKSNTTNDHEWRDDVLEQLH